MTDVSRDQQFADDLERATRSLRAAAKAARILGLSLTDLSAAVRTGVAEAETMPITHTSLARAVRLDLHPDGAPLPAPAHRLTVVHSDEATDVGGFIVPNLGYGRDQRAA